MAQYRPRRNKNGEITSVQIVISQKGEKDIYASYKPEWPGMTEQQIMQKARLFGAGLESRLKDECTLTRYSTFNEAAEYFIKRGMSYGNVKRTEHYYSAILVRINDPEFGIGNIPIGQISPNAINRFAINLSVSKNMQPDRVNCHGDMRKYLNEHSITQATFAKMAGVSQTTIESCIKHSNVLTTTAEKICSVYGDDISTLFSPVKKEKETLSSSFLNGHLTFIKAVFGQMVKEHIIELNPCDALRRFKSDPNEMEYLSMEEIKKVFSCLQKEENVEEVLFAIMLIFTGARNGEICGLKWENVNFETGEIYLCNNKQYDPHGKPSDGPLKNNENRWICLEPEVMDLLAKWKLRQDLLKQCNGDEWSDEGYVFTGKHGGCYHPHTPGHWLKKFAKRHDLPHIHPHMFRHSHASILIACGEDISTISRRLGHNNVSTTARIYVHAFEKGDRAASKLFSNALRSMGMTPIINLFDV